MLEILNIGRVIFRETMAAVSHYRERYETVVEDDNDQESESQSDTEEETEDSFGGRMKDGIETIRKWIHILLPSAIEGCIHGLAHLIGCVSSKVRDIAKIAADKSCEVFRKTVEEGFIYFRDLNSKANGKFD